jgi:hypothetical protein
MSVMHAPDRGTITALGACLLLVACGGTSNSPDIVAPSPVPTTTNGCGAIGPAAAFGTAIVNGTACSDPSSPVVLLILQDENQKSLGYCSGTVIGSRAILTAAHCLAGASVAIVRTGGGERARSTTLKSFPGYPDAPSSLDAGVVLTDQDIGLPAFPVLASRDATIGEQAVIAGWGDDGSGAGRTLLRAGVVAVSVVRDIYIQTKYLGANSSGVCWGDSGGPLFVSQGGAWVVAGVTAMMSTDSCAVNGTSVFLELRNPSVQSFVFGLVPDISRK